MDEWVMPLERENKNPFIHKSNHPRSPADFMLSNNLVRKAVIPIAGLGTRHFPASHAVKKELFPVVGADGIARALFPYHLLELEAAGIEEICIIVQPGEEQMVRDYLRGPGDAYLRQIEKYPALLREAEQMRGFAKRVSRSEE